MKTERFQEEISELGKCSQPQIVLTKRARTRGTRLGVFASSFNPVTNAHVALMEHAAAAFSLNEVLALAGTSNADKEDYESPLGARIEMLELGLAGRDLSIGISSTPFFVDMIDPIKQACPTAESLYFIVGYDTFVRIVDREGRYLARYQTRFSNTSEALERLLSASCMIVASRAGKGEGEIAEVVAGEPPAIAGRILFLDFPSDLGERSATEVRRLLRAGRPISGLVAPSVADYIQANGLYSVTCP
jgi:nicotinic acid mononucleotide adenylyltransferase